MNTKHKIIIATAIVCLVVWFANGNYPVTASTSPQNYVIPSILPTPTPTRTQEGQQAIEYVTSVFNSCSSIALAYLDTINPTLEANLVHHNYLLNRYTSSSYGLFLLNDQIPETQGYTIQELLDYKTNTRLAYALFLNNNKSFDSFQCQ